MRTHHKALTPEGQKRKVQRIITRLLEQRHPQTYLTLLALAEKAVHEDNEDPLSRIVDAGLNVMHYEHEEVTLAKKRQLQYLEALNKEDA